MDGDGDYKDVSIHTPTKGVTIIYSGESCVKSVSIHTPTKGVTAEINGCSAK